MAVAQMSTNIPSQKDELTLSGVNGITLNVQAGESVSLLLVKGGNAASFMRTVAGLDTGDANKAFLNGERLEHTRTGQNISLLTHELPMMGWRSVKANIALPLEVRSVPRTERLLKAQNILLELGLKPKGWTFPATLDAESRAACCLARAFIADPLITVFDNPFASVADDEGEHLTLILRQLWLRSTTKFSFFATNRISEAILAGKRILICRATSMNRANEPQLRVVGDLRHDGFDTLLKEADADYSAASLLATPEAIRVMNEIRRILAEMED